MVTHAQLINSGKPVIVTVVEREDGVVQMVAGQLAEKMCVHSKLPVAIESVPSEWGQNDPILYITLNGRGEPTVFIGSEATLGETSNKPIYTVVPLSKKERYTLIQIMQESGELMVKGALRTIQGMQISTQRNEYEGDIALLLQNGKLLWARSKRNSQ